MASSNAYASYMHDENSSWSGAGSILGAPNADYQFSDAAWADPMVGVRLTDDSYTPLTDYKTDTVYGGSSGSNIVWTLGGPTDLWGREWDLEEDTIVRMHLTTDVSDPFYGMKVGVFPSIPGGATLEGIKVEVYGYSVEEDFNYRVYVDAVRVTAYYSTGTSYTPSIESGAEVADNNTQDIGKNVAASASVSDHVDINLIPNSAPTVALDTPDEHVFNNGNPTLEFTATDGDGDSTTFEIQILSEEP